MIVGHKRVQIIHRFIKREKKIALTEECSLFSVLHVFLFSFSAVTLCKHDKRKTILKTLNLCLVDFYSIRNNGNSVDRCIWLRFYKLILSYWKCNFSDVKHPPLLYCPQISHYVVDFTNELRIIEQM